MKQITLLPVSRLPVQSEHRCACEIEHCAAPTCPRRCEPAPRRALAASIAAAMALVWLSLVGLCAAIACTARIQMLRYEIRSNEQYLDDAARAGIIAGDVIEEWHAQLRDARRRLRELEA